MDVQALFRWLRKQKPRMRNKHPGGVYRVPAERIQDSSVTNTSRQPISYYLKRVAGFTSNLFLAILGGIAAVMRMHFIMLLGCVIGIGALG